MTIAVIHAEKEQRARAHQDQLTKPRGALGRLEDIACWFAARQGKELPDPLQPHIAVFAGDHGVCDEGVSAYPSVVTGEMVKNFARGGAAINVLARQIGATLAVVDVGVMVDLSGIEGIEHNNVRRGTANLLHEAAMGEAECLAAIHTGRRIACEAIAKGANLLIAGDMGIGNTTASACLICRFSGATADAVVGFGTGVDSHGRQLKVDIVSRALARIGNCPDEAVLQQVGGLEIAAMAGFYLQAAEAGVPVVVDGFIAAAAALAARVMEPQVTGWMLASHVSRENGHHIALNALGLSPMIDFGMRLGEGSGAALIVPLLQSAIALHNEMATFASAGVTDKDE
ncbi:nicotinate-nucleotide--dimethylbenzimidazole phosphoribosyltransferase [Mariprofundus erugo]|uniref:Nicotinate-nucleotide--dimethylbenzimidazole phosphoribosyltransferase n=1 Tax=Mariprofundus erugo TaxID=2528639 RepID=A0A5R9GXS6_9PROT|nr:nicotinate-nucleotide--dimethylbenzimidazole phosphoribosyltransferase [Mariprofundus erugo]TLS68747.1 nicotinate-nucleotide--dimethylbenzimidazole phosphoribosyltransferase [Mariprofundus erugo]